MIVQGWLESATQIRSPNFNDRPDGAVVDVLVIHNISLPPGNFGSGKVQALFSNSLDWDEHEFFDSIRGLEVSSHLLIERDGRVTQFVSFDDRAWHAGVSFFEGRDNCNDFSIGIELEGTDDIPFTDDQYATLVEVTQDIMNTYPKITVERIVGHRDIAPGRKTDPGPAFDWQKYKNSLKKNN